MQDLPLELQLMTIENLEDSESLIALFDALPSTNLTIRDFLLVRIFRVLATERLDRIETLRACREAALEMRDLLGVERLFNTFQGILDSVDSEIAKQERKVVFRGLTHPSQGRTMLKKGHRKLQQVDRGLKYGHRRILEHHRSHFLEKESLRSALQEQAREIWLSETGKICLRTFMNNMYSLEALS